MMRYYSGVPHLGTEKKTVYFQENDFFEIQTTTVYKSSGRPRWLAKNLMTQMATPP